MIGRWTVVDKEAEDESQIDKSPYAYVANDPVNLDDPDGNCPLCIGALVGAVVDIAFQSIDIALDSKKSFSNDFSVKSVVVSAVAGAAGVGIASKVSQAVKLAGLGEKVLGTVINRAADAGASAAASAAGQKITTGKIDGTKVAIDAAAGALGGHLGDKATVSAAKSAEGKLLSRQADRATRVAVGGRASRVAAKEAAIKKSENFAASRSAAVGGASSGVVGSAVKDVNDRLKQKP